MNIRYLIAAGITTIVLSTPLIASSWCCNNDYVYNKTHFSARPQGNYYFVNMMNTADITHKLENKKNYFNATANIGYRQNTEPYELGRYFFTQIGPVIVGPINTDVDIQNLQLGLADNYKGTLVMQPIVSDVILDLDLFAGFDKWVHGGWLRVHFPFVRNYWCSNILSQTAAVGGAYYPDEFADVSGTTIPTVYQALSDATCGDTSFGKIPALSTGKLCCKSQACWGLSDIHFEIGYDFLRKKYGNMGIALIGAGATGMPTGKSCNQYLIAPTIGTQNSWQLGCALRGQYELFNFNNEKTITLYADARIAHVFQGCTKRLLTLNVGDSTAFNYWLLLNRYNSDGVFQGVERAANILNKKVKVSAGAIGEVTLMALTVKNQWRLALGYNFWFRSKEQLSIMDMTIGNGSDYYTLKDTLTPTWSSTIANKETSNIAQQPESAILSATLTNIKDNALRTSDIDVCSAQHPSTYANTFFVSGGYHFKDTTTNPFINIGGSIEFGRGNLALSTWGIYAQGGIAI